VDLIREELASACFGLSSRAEELAAACKRAPEAVFDDDTAKRTVLLSAQLGAFLTKVEAERTSRKEPILKHAKAIDSFFAGLTEKLAERRDELLERLRDYQTAIATGSDDKAQIRTDEGPIATSTVEKVVRIVDPAKVPDRFRVIDDKAIRAAVKAGEEVPGVEVDDVRKTLIK
jgi:hypothetical protein